MEQPIALQKMIEKIINRFTTIDPHKRHLALQASACALECKVNSINFFTQYFFNRVTNISICNVTFMHAVMQ